MKSLQHDINIHCNVMFPNGDYIHVHFFANINLKTLYIMMYLRKCIY